MVIAWPRIVGITLSFGLAATGAAAETSSATRAATLPAPHAAELKFFEARVADDPDDFTAWNRLGGLCLAELRRTGDLSWISRAEVAARESLRAVPAEQNLGGLGLRAQAAQAAHRFSAARDDGRLLASIAPQRGEAWMIVGDALFELGDYSEAERAWEELVRLEPESSASWIRRSRLARLGGDRRAAERGLVAALASAEAMTPKPADLLAWLRVQLGYLAFSSGDLNAAELAYRTALAESPGWYAAEDHLAEVLAAKGDFDGSVRLYLALAERLRRPELWQALGDVLVAAGRSAEAEAWHDRALAGYLAEAEAGNAHYYHHLAGFYAEVRIDADAAVRWARKDLEVRHSVQAWDALGWALYRRKDYAEARTAQGNALTQGLGDAHLLMHAAYIFAAAGDVKKGREFRRAALRANSRPQAFHVHR